MKLPFLYKIPAILALFAIVVPCFAFATVAFTPPNVWSPATLGLPLLICAGAPQANANPGPNGALPLCGNLCDLVSQFLNIIYIAIAWVIWIIAPIAFIAGGIMYMLAGANPGMESTARKALIGTVIGVVIVLCSYVILLSVVSAFTGLKNYIGGFGASLPGCN